MKCNLQESRMLEISRAYESLTARYLQWCATQRGTSGQALQLDLFKLPTLESGLKGLGIKEK